MRIKVIMGDQSCSASEIAPANSNSNGHMYAHSEMASWNETRLWRFVKVYMCDSQLGDLKAVSSCKKLTPKRRETRKNAHKLWRQRKVQELLIIGRYVVVALFSVNKQSKRRKGPSLWRCCMIFI